MRVNILEMKFFGRFMTQFQEPFEHGTSFLLRHHKAIVRRKVHPPVRLCLSSATLTITSSLFIMLRPTEENFQSTSKAIEFFRSITGYFQDKDRTSGEINLRSAFVRKLFYSLIRLKNKEEKNRFEK